ncbi:MAG TPA: VOC family protein [Solirubrobacteraceae bacterium]|nr:VOC family protein [Solirubrobacteraceae bacterium]
MTLNHVTLETRREDVEAEVAFWALLGFEQVQPPPGLRDRAAWVARDGTQIHLVYEDDPVVMPRGHPAVVAADYDAAVGRLRDAGFDVRPTEEHWGAARAFVRTPAGHRVEVMSAPPPP